MHKLLVTVDGPQLVQVLQAALNERREPEVREIATSGYLPAFYRPTHPPRNSP